MLIGTEQVHGAGMSFPFEERVGRTSDSLTIPYFCEEVYQATRKERVDRESGSLSDGAAHGAN